MNNKQFLHGLVRRGVNPYVWNGCVKWSDPSGVLSKAEKRRLRRLRPQVEALIAEQSASPAVLAGVDVRFDVPPAAHWSWKPPAAPFPCKCLSAQERRKANRKRSEATKAQPRAEGGEFDTTDTATTSGETRDHAAEAEGKTAAAKAAASGSNRGAVERMDELKEKRPPPDEAHWRATLGRELDRHLEDTP